MSDDDLGLFTHAQVVELLPASIRHDFEEWTDVVLGSTIIVGSHPGRRMIIDSDGLTADIMAWGQEKPARVIPWRVVESACQCHDCLAAAGAGSGR